MESERRAAAQAYFNEVASGVQKYTVEGISKHPTLAVVAKSDPGRIYNEIIAEITNDAAQRAQNEPNGVPITPEVAAARVESRYSEYRRWFVSGETPPAAPSAQIADTNQPKTSAVEAKTPPKVPQPNKALDKPLAPWLQSHDLVEAGIQAGIMEFKRAESAKK